MAKNEANIAPAPQPADEKSRRMLRVAATLLGFSFILLLCQLANLGVFQVKAYGADILPISIRAESRADYSQDPREFDVPPISKNIFSQIISDIPGTGSPEQRMGTLQAALLSPVPTMTGSSAPIATPTETQQNSTQMRHTETVTTSIVPTSTLSPSPSPKPTSTMYSGPYYAVVPTNTRTAAPTRTATPQLTATSAPTSTAINTTTFTPTATSTATLTRTPSATNTSTPTFTDTPTVTASPTNTATETATHTATNTSTDTATTTPSSTHTATSTHTPTTNPTFTALPTQTPTFTPSATSTPIHTPTPTETASSTATYTATSAPTSTATFTPTNTATDSPTSTSTQTATLTSTAIITPSSTPIAGLPVCHAGAPNGLLPSDDTFIKSDAPSDNYGSNSTFEVRPDPGADHRRGLLKFDLSSIPANSTITSATLYLYEKDGRDGQVTYIHRITSNWSENTTTWSSWNTPGGDYEDSISYFSYLSLQNNCMLTIDLTSLVQLWADGTYPNYGILLNATGPNHSVAYVAKEHGTSSQRPRLNIVYETATSTPSHTPTTTLTATPTHTLLPTPTSTMTFTATP